MALAVLCRFVMVAAWLAWLPLGAAADDDLESLEQQAIAAAVQRVAPCVVGIETVGGLERVESVLFGTGPTTGLVLDPQGYIVSSAFNFVNKPASILVRLPDGTRKSAKLVATDHSRMVVLLKIEVDHPLPVPEIAAEADLRVGQWCIGVGRTFASDRPNMSVGILSATGRIWGKALQTDAALSPNNYGGPLVDIRGRVLGVIVPLSPQSAEEIAGVEWYDSGIGFAVPAEHLRKVFAKLKAGQDLYPGVAGFSLKSRDMYMGETTIAACRPNSPAAKAGFQAGDRIVEIAGRKISRSAELKEEISRRYAGDRIAVAVLRGPQRIESELELVDKLASYQHPLLGILPLRATEKAGVTVRYVYPQSPAARAGIVAGDVLAKLAGKAVANRDELLRELGALEAGEETEIEVRHADQTRTVKITLDHLPDDLPPAELPPSRAAIKLAGAKNVKTGVVPLTVPEFKNAVWAYVPEKYDAAVPYGLVVWLQGNAAVTQNDLLARWKPLCDRYDLILLVPKADDAAGWKPEEATLVEKLIRQAQAAYHVDAARVVVHGRESGGTLACLLAFRNRDLIRAAVLLDALPAGQPPENEPLHRLALYVATAEKSPHAAATARLIALLRAQKIPVTLKKLGDQPRDLGADELAELVRWIDMLDRI
jgi:serine protease Do